MSGISNKSTSQRHYLDEVEVAQRLGLSVQFLRKRRERQLPPAYARFGRRIKYPVTEVEKFEASAMQPMAADLISKPFHGGQS